MKYYEFRFTFIENESTRLQQALQSANLSTEVGMICLDCMGLYCMHFREALVNGPIMERVASVYLSYLEIGQGECLSKHVFAALRAFINNFSHALFKGMALKLIQKINGCELYFVFVFVGNASLCGRLCYELLRCCDSRLISIRQESCAVLYLLMRSNFEFSGRKGITRVHLQARNKNKNLYFNSICFNYIFFGRLSYLYPKCWERL